jgi:hypothetical protein
MTLRGGAAHLLIPEVASAKSTGAVETPNILRFVFHKAEFRLMTYYIKTLLGKKEYIKLGILFCSSIPNHISSRLP